MSENIVRSEEKKSSARRREKLRILCIVALAFGGVFLLAYEILKAVCGLDVIIPHPDEDIRTICDMALTRGVAGVVFTIMMFYMGFRVMSPVRKPFFSGLLLILPAYAVAVNNFPILPVAFGGVVIGGEVYELLLLALECLAIGLFEEMAFRGVVLLSVMEKRRKNVGDLVISILISSAIFGVIHLVNLVTSSPGAVFMQIGYSFLIGAMCSIVLIRTGNIWHCVLVHAIFDFGGGVIDNFVVKDPNAPDPFWSEVWNAPSIILTAVLAVAVAVYMLVLLLRTDVRRVDRFYGE